MSFPKSRMAPDMGSCSAAEPIALQVTDDSMEPEFEKGVVIIIDSQAVVHDGGYVMAQIESGYIFRRLRVEEDGSHVLYALKEGVEEIRLPNGMDDIKGVIVQKALPTGKRKDRIHYLPDGQRREKN